MTNERKCGIISGLDNEPQLMEKSRSWPSAHDWKSCIPQKGIEGSNPSFSAISYKDTIEIRTLKFGVNGVFIMKSSIYAAFRGRIFFLSVGLKNE